MPGGTEIIRKLARAAQRVPSRRRKPVVPTPKRRDGGSPEALPVTPDRPLDLSGGAAAALEFDA